MSLKKHYISVYRRFHYMVVLLILLAVFFLNSCQPMGNALRDQRIPSKHLLMLPREGKLHITWEARHLTVAFKGNVRQSVLSLNAEISSHQDIRQFVKIDRLQLDIYFTNTAGRVLKQTLFYAAQDIGMKKVLQAFNHRFDLPKGTTRIAFGYEAQIGSRLVQHNPVQ